MRKVWTIAAFLVFAAAGAAAAQDARSVLQASASAMGADALRTIQYEAAGWHAQTGQSFSLEDDWPRWEVADYRRTIDYEAMTLREEYTRRRGSFPDRGGGLPFQGDQRVVQLLSGGVAWNMQGDTPVAQTRPYLDGTPVAELRQLEIMMTPHGFLKAAMAADPSAVTITIAGPTNAGLTENGGRLTLVAFEALGKYRIVGAINEQNLVELTTTWIPNPVYGDMLYEIRHLQYKDFGGVMFPAQIHVHQGDPVFNPAHNLMDIRVSRVDANVSVAPVPVPDAVRQAAAPPVRADARRIADGVWLVGGGSHNSVAVEFSDHMAVIEAPLNEARSLAVIDAVNALVPGKPIRYIVNSHHHFDHSGGLRTYVAHGITLVTHQANRDFYEQVMFHPAPRTLQPDLLATYYPNFTTSRRPVPIEPVHGKYVLSDGVRTVELHPIEGGTHAAGMIVAYMPTEKLLINADLYTPPANGAPLPPPNANMRTLHENMQRLKLDVSQHVPLHGAPGSNEEFLRIVSAGAE